MFDVTNKLSFEALDKYCSEIRAVAPRSPIVFMGNKIDLPDHQITLEQLRQKAKNFNAISSILTSAKSGEGVQGAFYTLGKALLQSPNPML